MDGRVGNDFSVEEPERHLLTLDLDQGYVLLENTDMGIGSTFQLFLKRSVY